MNAMKNIGWIGLGNMGIPMASNLLKSGYSVSLYLRDHSKADQVSTLISMGAKAITDLHEIVTSSEVLFFTLPDDRITESYLDLLDHLPLNGKTLINCSTISPSLAQKVNDWAQQRGCWYLDAPVSGIVKPAQDGTLSFLIGGEKSVYEKNIPFFEVLGSHHYYLGEAGMGSKAKLAINYYMSIVVQGLAETVLFAEQNGVSREVMTAIINNSACGSAMSKVKTPWLLRDEYPAAFPLKFMLKDLHLAQAEGWQTDLIRIATQTYSKAVDNGLKEEDLMAVIKAIQQPN